MSFITQSKTNWKFLFIVVILAVVVGEGILIYSNKMNKEIISSSQIIEIRIPEKVKDETADWQTYRNDEYGFEIKYPKDWYVEAEADSTFPEQEPGVIKFVKNFENYPSGEGSKKKDWRLISLGVEETSITKWLDTMKETEGKIEEITINSLKGYKAVNSVGIYAFVAKDKYVYSLMALFPDTITEKIFNQMLSTFKFLGNIDGSLGYPSEGIPSDMKVCAENIETKEQYCTSEHIKDAKYTYGEGYNIYVPAGNYYVFATLPNGVDYKAYYSEFVICGLKVDCPSHEPIKIKVRDGDIIRNIDPQDWYK